MAESFPETDLRARKTLSALLRAIDSVGLTPVAEACGVDRSTISRMKNDDFERFAVALTSMGLKCVPVKSVCYQPEYIQHLLYFARRGMNPDQFAEEDPE